MLAIPPALLEVCGLAPGRQVALSLEAGRLVIEPGTPPRYTLEQLLSQCDTSPSLSAEERAWLDAPVVGQEVL